MKNLKGGKMKNFLLPIPYVAFSYQIPYVTSFFRTTEKLTDREKNNIHLLYYLVKQKDKKRKKRRMTRFEREILPFITKS